MARSTFKVLFYVNGSKERNGIVPIMGRVTINGTVAQFSCKQSVPKTLWDIKGNRAKGKSKEARDINLALDNIKAQIIKHYQRISDREAFVTAEMVRNAYQGIGSEYETLLKAFDRENEVFKKRVGKDRVMATYQTEQLQTDIAQLQDRKETAQEELRQVKKEVQTEKLKEAATTAATNIAESVGSLFGSNKVKTLEKENSVLHQTVDTHEETIETLQTKIQTMQADHSRQVLDMQQKHINELQVKEIEHKKEVAGFTSLFNKAVRWFPQIKNMLNLERLCLAVGFNKEQTATLLTGKPIEYSGELYSEEYKRKFMAKDVKAKVFSDNGRLILTIDLRPIGEWFREQLGKLKQGFNGRQSRFKL